MALAPDRLHSLFELVVVVHAQGVVFAELLGLCEHRVLHVVEQGFDLGRDSLLGDELLFAVVAAHEHGLAAFDVARADLDAHRHAEQFVLVELPPRALVVVDVELGRELVLELVEDFGARLDDLGLLLVGLALDLQRRRGKRKEEKMRTAVSFLIVALAASVMAFGLPDAPDVPDLPDVELPDIGIPGLDILEDLQVKARIVAATNKDLASLVTKGLFREDLYHRINVFPIHLPPLRERREDIPLLVRHFIKEIGNSLGKKPVRLTESALNALMEPTWPGNVRELRNIIERAMILCKGGAIARNHLIFNEPVSARRMDRIDLEELCSMALDQADFSLEQLEERLLKLAMERAGYNVSGAARLLGMTRATLRYRLEKFGLTPQSSTFRPGRFSRPG